MMTTVILLLLLLLQISPHPHNISSTYIHPRRDLEKMIMKLYARTVSFFYVKWQLKWRTLWILKWALLWWVIYLNLLIIFHYSLAITSTSMYFRFKNIRISFIIIILLISATRFSHFSLEKYLMLEIKFMRWWKNNFSASSTYVLIDDFIEDFFLCVLREIDECF